MKEEKVLEPSDKDKEKMKMLLQYLKSNNKKKVNDLGMDLFIDKKGQCDWTNINYFKEFASCKIYALERDSFGWLIGGIEYNKKVYSYG